MTLKYYILKDPDATKVVKEKIAKYDKDCKEFKKKLIDLGFDVKNLIQEDHGDIRKVVGFNFKDPSKIDKSLFIKDHLPDGIPKVATPAGKLMRKEAPRLDVGKYLEDLLGLKPIFKLSGGCVEIHKISFGKYSDKIIVAVPVGMDVTAKHRKWIKRISDVEFEKIGGKK